MMMMMMMIMMAVKRNGEVMMSAMASQIISLRIV